MIELLKTLVDLFLEGSKVDDQVHQTLILDPSPILLQVLGPSPTPSSPSNSRAAFLGRLLAVLFILFLNRL
jgi:hypothetical protein